jgi:hypothetical protein
VFGVEDDEGGFDETARRPVSEPFPVTGCCGGRARPAVVVDVAEDACCCDDLADTPAIQLENSQKYLILMSEGYGGAMDISSIRYRAWGGGGLTASLNNGSPRLRPRLIRARILPATSRPTRHPAEPGGLFSFRAYNCGQREPWFTLATWARHADWIQPDHVPPFIVFGSGLKESGPYPIPIWQGPRFVASHQCIAFRVAPLDELSHAAPQAVAIPALS